MNVAIEITLEFAEWLDTNCVRNNEHEWTYRGDNHEKEYSTREIFDVFLNETVTYHG